MQQSSTVATFRAFVMLTCLLLIPLAAVCGTSFPSVVKAIQNGRWPTLADFRGPGENAKNGLSDAPCFAPARSPTTNSPFSPPQTNISAQPLRSGSVPDSQVMSVSYETPIANTPQQSTTSPQNEHAENRDFAAAGRRGLSQPPFSLEGSPAMRNGDTQRTADGQLPMSAQGGSQTAGSRSSNPDATFVYIQDRLKRLGATYYLLEAWGDQKDVFRFYCQMAIGGNPQVKQSFENVDADPLKAMAKVLAEVEDWKKHG